MLRVALCLLILVSACGTSSAPADPKALLERWRKVIDAQLSVRFDVEIRVDGHDARLWTYAGTYARNSGLGGNLERNVGLDVTAYYQARGLMEEYRALQPDSTDTYFRHTDLTLPPGKEYVLLDLGTGVGWSWDYLRDVRMSQRDYLPRHLFGSEIDRDTLRLVEHKGSRYVFNAGGVPHSGGYAAGPVSLVVEVDGEERVTKVELKTPSGYGQQRVFAGRYAEWGAAPAAQRPDERSVAKAGEVVVKKR